MRKYFLVFGVFLSVGLVAPLLSDARGMPPDNIPLLAMVGRTYYLGTNLHADMTFNKVSSVNYQKGGLLSWGRTVRIERVLRNWMLFADTRSGRRYRYEFHHKTRSATSLKKHVDRIFLDAAALSGLEVRIKGMSSVDQDGIYEGRALPGMTREGVIIAIGYPPEFANRGDLMTLRKWHYWIGRFDKMEVFFDRRGRVAVVKD